MDPAYRISLDHPCCRVHVECGDYGKCLYIATFHSMNRGVWDSWRTLPCWQVLSHFNWVTLAPEHHHLQAPFPLLQEPSSSWISVSVQDHPWQRHHFSSTPGLLLLGSTLFLGTCLIPGLLLITLSFLGNGKSSC